MQDFLLPRELFQPKGIWIGELFGPDGKLKARRVTRNTVVNEGKNSILNVYFLAATPLPNWFMGLIDNSSFSVIAAADTLAAHAGWIEFTAYSAGTRPAWVPATSTAQSLTNTTPISFAITGSATLKGGLIASNSTKGGTTGVLWSAAIFGTPLVVNNGDTFRNTYTLAD